MNRVPSDLTTILLTLQSKLITDGVFRDTACWLSLTPELAQYRLGKMPAESVALIYPMAMPVEQPVVTGGGNDTMLVRQKKPAARSGAVKVPRGQGKSLREIADWLNERGIRPKRGKCWLHSSVIRILSRPAGL